jgi:hypothetical protein
MISPEECVYCYILAIYRDITGNASEAVLLEWRKYCRTVCLEHVDVDSTDALYWLAWNERELFKISNDMLERTARQKACEVYNFKKRQFKLGQPTDTASLADVYSKNIRSKQTVDASAIQQALVVHDKICKVPEIVQVIERMERQFGNNHCFNSISKMVKIAEKVDTIANRILAFRGVEDAIARGHINNSKCTRDYLTGTQSNPSFVSFVLFRWKTRQHLLAIEMPREKMDPSDIIQISTCTADYDAYSKFVESTDGSERDTTWIGAMCESSALALRVIQDRCESQ